MVGATLGASNAATLAYYVLPEGVQSIIFSTAFLICEEK